MEAKTQIWNSVWNFKFENATKRHFLAHFFQLLAVAELSRSPRCVKQHGLQHCTLRCWPPQWLCASRKEWIKEARHATMWLVSTNSEHATPMQMNTTTDACSQFLVQLRQEDDKKCTTLHDSVCSPYNLSLMTSSEQCMCMFVASWM